LDGGVGGCPECSSANNAVGLYADATMERYLQIYVLVCALFGRVVRERYQYYIDPEKGIVADYF
jgi:hypothetical protein